MQIILSRYNSKDLKAIYEEEESKTDSNLKDTLELVSSFLGFMFLIYPLTYFLITERNRTFETITSPAVLIPLIISFLLCFLYYSFVCDHVYEFLIEHCEKKGKRFTHPLNGYFRYISFIKMGEELNDILHEAPDTEILLTDSSHYEKDVSLFRKNPKTGTLEPYMENDFYGRIFFPNLENFIPSAGTMDFSIHDKELENMLQQIVD